MNAGNAYAGLISLVEVSQQLGNDHANARMLAEGLAQVPQIDIDVKGVHSNIVVFWLR